jgi:hypothetical protein
MHGSKAGSFSEDKPFELDPGSPEIDQESDADTRRLELVQ